MDQDADRRQRRKSGRRKLRAAIAEALDAHYRALIADTPADKFNAWLENVATAPEARDQPR